MHDLKTFLLDSRGIACGWVGHFFGQNINDLEALRRDNKLTVSQTITLDWIKLFRELGPQMTRREPAQN